MPELQQALYRQLSNKPLPEAAKVDQLWVRGNGSSTSSSTGSAVVIGGMGVGERLYVGSDQDTDAAGSDGALNVVGGVRVGASLYVDEALHLGSNASVGGSLDVQDDALILGSTQLRGRALLMDGAEVIGDLTQRKGSSGHSCVLRP